MSQDSMREKMPISAAFIDGLRRVFGEENINQVIRRGMRGEPGVFFFSENGHTVGTPSANVEQQGDDLRK